jgi:uncharacterized protein YndB with AHSA1/START domain
MIRILHTVQIHATAQAVYRALTTQEGVTGWWTRKATLDQGEGGVIRFRFHGDFHPHMRQTTLREPHLVEWRCVEGHSNWQDNTFRFALGEQSGETLLRFVQEYAQELDDETYGTYNFNWGYYLNSLKHLCETGTGTPFEPPG